jgi:hypothetical protein
VLKHLMDKHKLEWLECYRKALTWCTAKGTAFLHRIVIDDGSWGKHYTPESMSVSIEKKHVISPTNKKFKATLTACLLHVGTLKKYSTLTSLSVVLLLIQIPTVQCLWNSQSRSKGNSQFFLYSILLPHKSACPHLSHQTVNHLQKSDWEVLHHPVHSSDLAPPVWVTKKTSCWLLS